jgi:ABC-type glycerol-3-phosphate transport system substrate-binding protein
MKKTILSSVSILALLALASCSTDNMPTEADGGSQKQAHFNAMDAKTTNDANVQTDSIPNPIEVTSRTADNGDIAILKDKRKIINSASSAQENGDIAILKDKRK